MICDQKITINRESRRFDFRTLSTTQAQLWYNRFKEGREDVNDYAYPGRPTNNR